MKSSIMGVHRGKHLGATGEAAELAKNDVAPEQRSCRDTESRAYKPSPC
jgi:hypothetical protein